MVAFIHDHLAILSDKVLHLVFSVEALDHSDIHATHPVHIAPADMPDRLAGSSKHSKAFLPLIEQLLAMNDNQSINLAFCDQPCCNGGLSECGGSAEDAFVVCVDLRDGFFLEGPS